MIDYSKYSLETILFIFDLLRYICIEVLSVPKSMAF